MVEVSVERTGARWIATVRVDDRGRRTEHRVLVEDEDLVRYGAGDPAELVTRSFEFLLAREPNTSILREFRVTEIERYFPEYAETMHARR